MNIISQLKRTSLFLNKYQDQGWFLKIEKIIWVVLAVSCLHIYRLLKNSNNVPNLVLHKNKVLDFQISLITENWDRNIILYREIQNCNPFLIIIIYHARSYLRIIFSRRSGFIWNMFDISILNYKRLCPCVWVSETHHVTW